MKDWEKELQELFVRYDIGAKARLAFSDISRRIYEEAKQAGRKEERIRILEVMRSKVCKFQNMHDLDLLGSLAEEISYPPQDK